MQVQVQGVGSERTWEYAMSFKIVVSLVIFLCYNIAYTDLRRDYASLLYSIQEYKHGAWLFVEIKQNSTFVMECFNLQCYNFECKCRIENLFDFFSSSLQSKYRLVLLLTVQFIGITMCFLSFS